MSTRTDVKIKIKKGTPLYKRAINSAAKWAIPVLLYSIILKAHFKRLRLKAINGAAQIIMIMIIIFIIRDNHKLEAARGKEETLIPRARGFNDLLARAFR